MSKVEGKENPDRDKDQYPFELVETQSLYKQMHDGNAGTSSPHPTAENAEGDEDPIMDLPIPVLPPLNVLLQQYLQCPDKGPRPPGARSTYGWPRYEPIEVLLKASTSSSSTEEQTRSSLPEEPAPTDNPVDVRNYEKCIKVQKHFPGTPFKVAFNAAFHYRVRTSPSSQKYKCQCEFKTDSDTNFRAHIILSVFRSKCMFPCSEGGCRETFSSPQLLKEHLQSRHEVIQVEETGCPLCGELCQDHNELGQHWGGGCPRINLFGNLVA